MCFLWCALSDALSLFDGRWLSLASILCGHNFPIPDFPSQFSSWMPRDSQTQCCDAKWVRRLQNKTQENLCFCIFICLNSFLFFILIFYFSFSIFVSYVIWISFLYFISFVPIVVCNINHLFHILSFFLLVAICVCYFSYMNYHRFFSWLLALGSCILLNCFFDSIVYSFNSFIFSIIFFIWKRVEKRRRTNGWIETVWRNKKL